MMYGGHFETKYHIAYFMKRLNLISARVDEDPWYMQASKRGVG